MIVTKFLKLFYTLSFVCLVGAPGLINWPLPKFMSNIYSKGEGEAEAHSAPRQLTISGEWK
jgi:hypothetical protein